jgi:hypothetical protein
MDDRGDGIRWPSQPCHVPLSYNHHQPGTGASFQASSRSVFHNQAANGSATHIRATQAFISKIRDDAALCRQIKQRKTRWIEVSTELEEVPFDNVLNIVHI